MRRTLIIAAVIAAVLVGVGAGQGLCKWEDEQALSDLIRAARSGDTDAMVNLALAYYNGDGVLKDPFKAKCWTKRAHDLGEKRAEKIWNRLKLWQYSGKCALDFDDKPEPANDRGDSYREPVTGMGFVWLPGKCFRAGCGGDTDCGRNTLPAKRVCLDGFWMGETEVTQQQWMAVMDRNPSRFKGDTLPVEQVSFEDVRDFIQRLNRMTGQRFSLPTEAQWEFACRSRGRRMPYPWGNEGYRPKANCGGCDTEGTRGRTASVGSYLPNESGLYDMGGNVREWCRSAYDDTGYAKGVESGRRESKNSPRVVRGGSYVDPVSASLCRARNRALPQMKANYIGFRLMIRKVD
ncbi:MAG: SUMF1/EgtB/PvdO family nonheme iron enzyme [Desulfobacterales bacterium]|nr:SUMF1/EgtB/PvdO family nonheme iron enzyme [Desulfobacterales bacterium]